MAKLHRPGSYTIHVLLVLFLLQHCSSLAVRQNAGCGFHIRTNGSVSFPVGELASGQARAGSGMKASLFTWFGDAFVDQQGRGCWWTPPTSILQCDPGQMPDHGHEINCDGQLAFHGQTTFFQCETGDGDQVNIYTIPSGVRCNYITLFADDCHPECGQNDQAPVPFPSYRPTSSVLSLMTTLATISPSGIDGTPLSSTSTSQDTLSSLSSPTPFPGPTTPGSSTTASDSDSNTPSPPSSASATGCTPSLDGQSESPHLMVPVDSAHPDQAYGPNFYGQISPNASTFYNFDIPAADAGKTCTLFFDFPRADLTSTGYMWSGTGKLRFEQMRSSVVSNTTYNSRPEVFMDLADFDMEPGNKYVVNSFPCPAGDRVTFCLRGDHGKSDTSGDDTQDQYGTCLYYLQEHKPVPMGLFIAKC